MARLMTIKSEYGYDIPMIRGKMCLQIRHESYPYAQTLKLAFIMTQAFGGIMYVTPEKALEDYGTLWRLWEGQPTDDELDNTPWKDENA